MTEQELTAPAPAQPLSLRRRAAVGGVWTIGGFGIQKVLQLASNIILTRILFPEAFGLMALASVFMIGLAMFSDVGIKPAIIQNQRGEDEAFLNTAWTIQIIRGFALWAGACLIAWPASLIYGEPVLFPLLCVIGTTAAISGFASTAFATTERRLHFGRLTAVQLGGQAVSIIVTVALAWQMRSVWALAIGAVAGAAINVALGHLILPAHRHAVHIERQALSAIFTFGRWIFLGTMMTFLGGQGQRAIQGLLAPIEIIGFLSIASTFGSVFTELASKLITSVGYPILSRIAHEESDRLKPALLKIRLPILGAAIPAFLILSLLSNFIINSLYDERYSSAGAYLAVFAITGAIAIVPMGYHSAMMALGRTKTLFVITSISALFQLIGLTIGFLIADIIGMLIGIAVGQFVGYCATVFNAQKIGFAMYRLDIAAFTAIIIGAYFSFSWNL